LFRDGFAKPSSSFVRFRLISANLDLSKGYAVSETEKSVLALPSGLTTPTYRLASFIPSCSSPMAVLIAHENRHSTDFRFSKAFVVEAGSYGVAVAFGRMGAVSFML